MNICFKCEKEKKVYVWGVRGRYICARCLALTVSWPDTLKLRKELRDVRFDYLWENIDEIQEGLDKKKNK